MASYIETYGYRRESLLTSPEEVRDRLRGILADKVLRFNPYAVDDKTLLACVERARWMPFPAITQMVVFHFMDIRVVGKNHPYEAIFFRVGNDPDLQYLPVMILTDRLTYTATRTQTHVMVNGRPLTNAKMVANMQGKDFFVTHALPVEMPRGGIVCSYRMFRLRGSEERKAEIIRARMVESKIAMLEEILTHPYEYSYLRCSRHFIDYTTPIRAAIEAIRRFPSVLPPNFPKS